MPANKYALIRYRVIDRLISNKYKPYPGVQDLMDACGEALGKAVSKSTIEKDLNAMKNDGSLGYEAPIRYNAEYRGYYYEDPNYTIGDVPLSDDEIDSIQFAAKTLQQFKSIPIFKQYEAAIDKIVDRSVIGSQVDKEQPSFIQFESLPQARGSEWLEPLIKAIQERWVVTFDYGSFKKTSVKKRIVDPYLLKEYRHRWYLIGWSEEKAQVIVYGLDRMKGLKLLDEHFEAHTRFNPDVFFKYSVGITVGTEPPGEVRIKTNKVLEKYLLSQPLHNSQKCLESTEESAIFSYQLTVTYELIERLTGFGPEVEVLRPKSLRIQLKKRLQQALSRYA